MKKENNKINPRKKRRVKIEMSTELDTFMDSGTDEKTQLENIAKVYSSCFGDRDIKIESIKFLD